MDFDSKLKEGTENPMSENRMCHLGKEKTVGPGKWGGGAGVQVDETTLSSQCRNELLLRKQTPKI